MFPFPTPGSEERGRIERSVADLRDLAEQSYDPKQVEEERWIGDDFVADLGERGLLGLYVPEKYGGMGLSQTGYCRVSEEFGRIDGTLAVVMGVHQSIGMKGIVLFGTDEQKERFLPDLAAGRKLAGFALTEPEAGSDAYHLDSRAEKMSDGSYRLNGEKRYIGNGERGDVFVTFARTDKGHIALIVEKGMDGFEVGERFDTLGLRGNDLRRLYFKDVRVPPENVLGEDGRGFQIAAKILDSGRMSLGTGSAGAVKKMLSLGVEHTTAREQFDQPLADFELVAEKLGWIATHLFGLESMSYLTTGLVDRGMPDVSLESAMVKVTSTEFLWYAVNRVFQLGGGEAYMRTHPYEKMLRDIRIFPIFEGSNDVLRSYIALSGVMPLIREVHGLGDIDLSEPVKAAGTFVDYAADRLERTLRSREMTLVHAELSKEAERVSSGVRDLRTAGEVLLRRHGKKIRERQLEQKRLAHAAMDIYAQIAVLSRMTLQLGKTPPAPAEEQRKRNDAELRTARTFLKRAADRTAKNIERIDEHDDASILGISEDVRGERGYAFDLLERLPA